MTEEKKEILRIDFEEELSFFHLDGKWNDYIGVQKCVIGQLKEAGFLRKML